MFNKGHLVIFYLVFTSYLLLSIKCDVQTGPDPWNYEDTDLWQQIDEEGIIPPDLRLYPKKKAHKTDSSYGIGEWFYRRLLSIVLKSGQVNQNEDGSIDISIQMKLDQTQLATLEEYLRSTTPLTEDMLRRSLGYIEQSIYEPSLPTKIILAWSDYIQMYVTAYKTEITWTLALLAALGLAFWIWKHMSHRHTIILILLALYAYEVFVSYKEAEQKEVDRFMAAIDQCKWSFWSSKCEVPKPNPLIFLKHMNPLKIGIRMFTTIISEPMITLSDTVKIMTHGVTDGLWYPFNVIFYGILITFFNILLIIILIMVVFNFILNISIDFNIFGLIGVGLKQRRRNLFGETSHQKETPQTVNSNAIDNNVVGKLLDVISQALNVRNNQVQNAISNQVMESNTSNQITNSPQISGLRRSASTGRLPNFQSFDVPNKGKVKRRNLNVHVDGSGDAH